MQLNRKLSIYIGSCIEIKCKGTNMKRCAIIVALREIKIQLVSQVGKNVNFTISDTKG